MSRASVIVSLWLLLTGGVGDALLSGAGAPLRLLGLYVAASLLTCAALWMHFDGDAPRPRRYTMTGDRYHYD